ncbi:MAG: hypothetical protein JSW28_04765 [Thermoplasmata archaeon]|nr:MAG: hypothetical protein JSW28_04765 [Thermoplasmata archaeon]
MLKQLGKDEAEKLIITLLKEADRPLTTREVEARVQGEGKQCPDSAVRFLSKMRYKGLVLGMLSKEHKGWIWWVEKGW